MINSYCTGCHQVFELPHFVDHLVDGHNIPAEAIWVRQVGVHSDGAALFRYSASRSDAPDFVQ